ncbi:MAG: hypothetical protein U9P14_09485 [Gemmatimonadota bacterium]|nr:hypothetical protein [Gemmatimonadota bacterium]
MNACESATLALQVQTSVQRKVLDQQSQLFQTLFQSVEETSRQCCGGRNDSLGNILDVIA